MVDSLGRVVNVTTWILLITSIFAIGARFSTKFTLSRNPTLDDGLALLGLLFSIGSGVAVSFLDINGLGVPLGQLSQSQLDAFAKALYASQMLFVATLCLIKLSIVILLWLITPAEDHRRLLMVTAAFVVVTGLVSEFTEAFQCRVPSTWDFLGNNQCFDQAAFWRYFGSVNILSDLVLILVPAYIFMGLQLKTQTKLTIVASFGMRILDIGASVVLLAFTSEFDSPNVTVDLFAWVLITQIVQCVTITTSCIPYLRPLLKAYPSGMFKNDDVRRKGTKISYAAGSRDQEIETVALRAPSNSSHTGKEALSSHRESSIGPSVEEA